MKYIAPCFLLLLFQGFCAVVAPAFSGEGGIQTQLDFGETQLFFEENKGQFSSEILFQTSVAQTQVRFLSEGISYAQIREVTRSTPPPSPPKYQLKQGFPAADHKHYEALVWNVRFLNASFSHPAPQGHETVPGQFNYFTASTKSSGIQRFKTLAYQNLYPGIDLEFYGTPEHQLKYDFKLAARAELSLIRLAFEGPDRLSIAEDGSLLIHTPWGITQEAAPISYQLIRGRKKAVNIRYRLIGEKQLGFEAVEAYDPDFPLVIDPIVLNWSTYVHSSTSDDYVMAIDVDAKGRIYATGYTKTYLFPTTPGVYQQSYGGSLDAFIVRLDALGQELEYATFMGGSKWEIPYSLVANAHGEVFVGGFTQSQDLPMSGQGMQKVSGGGQIESFVYKLSSSGNFIEYSTYLGGHDRDYLYGMSLGPQGSIFLSGLSFSHDFPVSADAHQSEYQGQGDIFFSQLNANGTALIYSSFLGGSANDRAQGIRYSPLGQVYMIGATRSPDFPATTSVTTGSCNFNSDNAFVSAWDVYSKQWIYTTCISGSDHEEALGIDISPEGEALITGITFSKDFPMTKGAFQSQTVEAINPLGDVFVSKLNATGTELVFSTLLSGSSTDFGQAIGLDAEGYVYVLGATRSQDFPTVASESSHTLMYDLFLSKLNPTGDVLEESHFIGGELNDYPRSSSSLRIYEEHLFLGITTHSEAIPISGSPYQANKMNGNSDTPWLAQYLVTPVLNMAPPQVYANWNAKGQLASIQVAISPEMDWSHFILERNQNNEGWQALEKQVHHTRHRFVFTDLLQGVKAENVWYRVKVMNPAGIHAYSLPIRLSIRKQLVLKLHTQGSEWQFKLEGNTESPLKAELYNTQGRLVFAQAMDALQQQFSFEVGHLSSGLYVVKVHFAKGTALMRKLIHYSSP